MDQQGSHKATVGLEYIYCKKGNLLCNIWEGGGNFDTNLIKMIQVRIDYEIHKLGCIFLVVVVSAEFGPHEHREESSRKTHPTLPLF